MNAADISHHSAQLQVQPPGWVIFLCSFATATGEPLNATQITAVIFIEPLERISKVYAEGIIADRFSSGQARLDFLQAGKGKFYQASWK